MKIKLGDVCQVYSGGDRPEIVFEEPTGEYKIPIYGNSLENEGLYGYSNFSVINKKAITISARGSNCGVAFYRNEPYVPIVRLLSLIPDESIVNTEYLFYVIKNHPFKGSGSGQPQITIPQVANCEVEIVEDIYLQKRIAKVLSGFDLKIKNNSAINIVLEESAKTIYDYWFLQFDFPNEHGKPYKSSGGKMVWNEELQREIPEGWEVKEVGSLIESVRGISYNSSTLEGEGVPMINLASFNVDGSYKVSGIKTYSGEYGQDKILKPYDLVMCNTQQTAIDFKKDIIGKALLVPDIFEGDIVSSHHVTRIKVEVEQLKFYLHRLFNTVFFHKYITGYTNGTNILGLVFDGVERYKIVIPDDKTLLKFADIMENIEKQKSKMLKENQELCSLREFLLPLLMNGQVGFRED